MQQDLRSQNAGLAVGNVSSAYSDSVASGQIISQSPVADTAVDAGTAVDFVVSMGAEPAQEVKPTTYKINLNIKKPNNEPWQQPIFICMMEQTEQVIS